MNTASSISIGITGSSKRSKRLRGQLVFQRHERTLPGTSGDRPQYFHGASLTLFRSDQTLQRRDSRLKRNHTNQVDHFKVEVSASSMANVTAHLAFVSIFKEGGDVLTIWGVGRMRGAVEYF